MTYPAWAAKTSAISEIEELPHSWRLEPLCVLLKEVEKPNRSNLEQNLLSLSYGRIVRRDINSNDGLLPESFETYQIVEPSDIVLRLTDLQNDQRSLRVGYVPERGIITSAYLALKATDNVNSKYLYYLLHAYDLMKIFYGLGGGVRQTMKYADMKWLPLALPPLQCQTEIVTFLDRETAKADALVAQYERLIELLEEKREGLITQAVTKGLDPNAAMKDSGIEGIGPIPRDWTVVRLKHTLRDIKAGPFGSALTKDMYVNAGYRVYGQEQVIPNDFAVGDYYITEDKYRELRQYKVSRDDILISCVGTFGKVAVVPPEAAAGIINPRLIRLRCAPSVDSQFLATVLRSAIVFEELAARSRGGTMDVINIGTLSDVRVPLPSVGEQKRIQAYIERESANFTTLKHKAGRANKLLTERRAALITAAVTGRIDVRTYKAKDLEGVVA